MVKRDYTVRLERVFQGPMDLLLHLVREQEVEIHEIEISKVLEGYLAYLDTLEKLDLEYASDFLVMAATLMAIKSRSLLPREEVDLAEELDPKDELIQRLLEYRKFRGASEDLEKRLRRRERQTERGWREESDPVERTFDLSEVTAWDLMAAYARLLRETRADRPHHVMSDPRPLRYYVDHVVHELRAERRISLRALMDTFEEVPEREALIGSFCALLELVRLRVVDVEQEGSDEDIAIAMVADNEGDLEQLIEDGILDESERVAAPADEARPVDPIDGGDQGRGEPASGGTADAEAPVAAAPRALPAGSDAPDGDPAQHVELTPASEPVRDPDEATAAAPSGASEVPRPPSPSAPEEPSAPRRRPGVEGSDPGA